jgi:hypothetical protein
MKTGARKSLPFIAIGVSIMYALALFFGNSTLLGVTWIILGFLLTILMALMAWMAGIVVLKALFVVAAELSLLIFLTQSFCAAPMRAAQNNSAMTSLFTVGLVYIGFIFFNSLWDALKTKYSELKQKPRTIEWVVTVISFFLFVCLFLWELYLIINPIVASLCVYK